MHDQRISLLSKAFILFILPGCSSIYYKSGTDEFHRTSYLTNLEVQSLDVSMQKDGSKKFTLEGYTSDQTKALKAVAEGVAKGMAEAAKP